MTGNLFDAQDLTQETFLSAYQKLEEFDGRYERAWICRIATNKCLDFLKSSERRTETAEEEVFLSIPDRKSDPEQSFLQKESGLELLKLCEKLPPPYGEIAAEHFCQEKTARQIAEEKGRSVKTVQTQLYRARALLKKQLKGGNAG